MRFKKATLSAASLLLLSSGLHATNIQWKGGAGDWDDTSLNWTVPPSTAATSYATATGSTANDDQIRFGGAGGAVSIATGTNVNTEFLIQSDGYSFARQQAGGAINFKSLTLAGTFGTGTVSLTNGFGGGISAPKAIPGAALGTVVLDNSISGTLGSMTGDFNLVKTGGGLLQYTGFSGAYYNNSAAKAIQTDLGLFAAVLPAPGNLDTAGGNTGSVTVNQGVLQVSGYLNMWVEWPGAVLAPTPVPGTTTTILIAPEIHMAGVREVVLNGSAILDFTNSDLNVAPLRSTQGLTDAELKAIQEKQALGEIVSETGTTKRYNFVNNLRAGAQNNQAQTRLFTGLDTSYRIVVNIDGDPRTDTDAVRQQTQGSIGVLEGAGDVIKTGKGNFTILNSAATGFGRLSIAQGSVTLADANGRALANAASVNLAGSSSPRGAGVDAYSPQSEFGSGRYSYWHPAVVAAPDGGTLVLANSQLIRNLQSDFAFKSAGKIVGELTAPVTHNGVTYAVGTGYTTLDLSVAQAALNSGDEAFIPGTGVGSAIFLDGHTLTIRQDRDGVFAGNIFDKFTPSSGVYVPDTVSPATGRIVKEGSGTLVLIPQDAYFADVVVNAGHLITNAQALGVKDVTVNGGGLIIYQTNAGALKASLIGSGSLIIGASAFVDNGSGRLIQLNGDGNVGFLQIAKAQSHFTGNVLVQDGVTLQLTGEADALAGATAVTLTSDGDVSGSHRTTLQLGSTVQHLNNLSADENSLLDLKRATLFLSQSDATAFRGTIVGVGNLVKTGGATMVLNATNARYYGATAVAAGTLVADGADGVALSSGLILANGATFRANGNQTFGALFGTAGTSVVLNGGSLTIGTSATRATLLSQQAAGGTLLSSDYLGTSATALDLTGTPGIAAFDYASLATPGSLTSVSQATSLFLRSVGLSAAEADSFAFAGKITGTGGLIKLGSERLLLTGVSDYTGATSIQAGELQANWNSLTGTSGVAVASGATFVLNADTSTGDGVFSRVLSGTGLVQKIGTGLVEFSGDASAFTGSVRVSAGTLKLNTAQSLAGTVTIDAAGTLLLNQSVAGTLAAPVTNAGLLVKSGEARLGITSYAGAGAVRVDAGTLAMTALPASLTVAGGAIYEGTVNGTLDVGTVVSGTGTVSFVAGTGAPLVRATADDLFSTILLNLKGVTFDLNGTTQTLAGFSGDSASAVALSGGTLAFDTSTTTTFDGLLTGAGSLTKSGTGTLVLSSTVPSVWTGTITVDAGTLQATPESLGDLANTVLVNVDGTFAVHNADTLSAKSLLRSVTGAGKLAKTGAGEVRLGSVGVTGGVEVREGRLTVTTATAPSVFTSVAVATGATYQVDFTNDLLHDSASADRVSDLNGGYGSLAANGAYTLRLAGTQSYHGNTELLGGATLDLATNGITTLNGLAGEAGTMVSTTGTLTLVQNVAGTYAGGFSPGTALTLEGSKALTLSGDLAARGLASVTNAGVLLVTTANTLAIENTGKLSLQVSGADRYTGALSGSGDIEIVGDAGTAGLDKLSFGDGSTTGIVGAPYVLQTSGTVTVRDGAALGGVFSLTSGNLVVSRGARLSPGNSPGTVTVGGNFTLAAGADLEIELNATTSDQVVVSGGASLAGTLTVRQDNTPGSTNPAGGKTYTILTAAGGITGAFSNASASGMVQLSPADQAATGGVRRVHVTNSGTTLSITTVKSLADVAGFRQHDGLGGLVTLLDSGTAPAAVRTVVENSWGDSTTALVNTLSPLGYASEYAMAQDGAQRRQALLHDRLEQRRYDRASSLSAQDAPWEAFAIVGSSRADNRSKASTPTFDYSSNGGMVGLDRKMDDTTSVGLALAYDQGRASIHDAGGTLNMQRASATAFLGTQLDSRWYLDGGISAGYASHDATRRTAVPGTIESENGAYEMGAFVESGTVVVLADKLHLTPHLGVSYTHHEFEGFTESGTSDARLHLDAWSNDSLRVKAGTGLAWSVDAVKFGMDVSYAHELLDTDSKFDARYVAGGSAFRTTAAALPADSVSLTPSISWTVDESASLTLGYTYELGFDARSYQSVNLAYRKRF